MDRRDFFRKGACVAALAGAAGLVGCKQHQQGAFPRSPEVEAVPTEAAASAASHGGSVAAGTQTGKVGQYRVFDKPPGGVHVAVASKKQDAGALVAAAVSAFGGIEAVVKKGDVVVIKPNLAWAREPEVGANTSPEVLAAVIKLVQEAGAKEVSVVEHTCDSSRVSFAMSGGEKVCDELGVRLVSLDSESQYQEQPILRGVNITTDLLARDILECDVYINLPCLKHHSATNVSLAMKNQMGANFDRQRYHQVGSSGSAGQNLHQNIADLATALRPTLTIMDATRALTTNGPKGPGNVKRMDTIIVSHDMVAADALGTQMLGYSLDEVAHVRLAGDAGVGSYDLDSLKIARV